MQVVLNYKFVKKHCLRLLPLQVIRVSPLPELTDQNGRTEGLRRPQGKAEWGNPLLRSTFDHDGVFDA
jgi:hypothetical protein